MFVFQLAFLQAFFKSITFLCRPIIHTCIHAYSFVIYSLYKSVVRLFYILFLEVLLKITVVYSLEETHYLLERRIILYINYELR